MVVITECMQVDNLCFCSYTVNIREKCFYLIEHGIIWVKLALDRSTMSCFCFKHQLQDKRKAHRYKKVQLAVNIIRFIMNCVLASLLDVSLTWFMKTACI